MLIKVILNLKIIFTNYTIYDNGNINYQITGGWPLWIPQMSECMIRRRKVTCSEVNEHNGHIDIIELNILICGSLCLYCDIIYKLYGHIFIICEILKWQ